MNNKVLVELTIPELDISYDIYLPINKKIGNIINLINKAVNELSNGEFPIDDKNCLYNVETNEKYAANTLLANTDIRNGTKLILMT